MPRNYTLDYKVDLISKYVRWELLGYRKGQRLKEEDKKAHEMHMGFSAEEKQRCKENPNPMFVNRFPLVDMQLERRNNYAYVLLPKKKKALKRLQERTIRTIKSPVPNAAVLFTGKRPARSFCTLSSSNAAFAAESL